jgi:hypothetical protein
MSFYQCPVNIIKPSKHELVRGIVGDVFVR